MTELKIYGEHDERTVSQMWRCMGVGSVAGGVLCADGHLGYAQPVGGVIAYEDHVSISGVGFDIACGNMAARLNLKYEDIKDRVPVIANDIGKQHQLRARPHQPEADRPRGVRFAAVGRRRHRPPQADGARAARHRRLRQPLRRPVRGRGRLRLDRRAFRLARLGPQERDSLPQARRRQGRHRRRAGDRRGRAASSASATSRR